MHGGAGSVLIYCPRSFLLLFFCAVEVKNPCQVDFGSRAAIFLRGNDHSNRFIQISILHEQITASVKNSSFDAKQTAQL